MPQKPVILTSHARFEMRRRGISEVEVRRVVREPGQILRSRKGRQIYQSRIANGRLLLRVVVKQDASGYHVITTYKTSKIARYWR
jgi:hypothetical protein